MKPGDFDAFSEIVAGFAELKGRQLSTAAVKLYWRAMQHWELEDFRAAAEHLLRSCEFMPVPADFERLRKAGTLTAGEAWARVLDHTRGAWRDGSGLDDGGPVDRAVQALGGYRAVAFYDAHYLGVLERRFAEHFDAMQDADGVRDALPQLAVEPRRPRVGHQGPRQLASITPDARLDDGPAALAGKPLSLPRGGGDR